MKSKNKYVNPNPLKKETSDCVVRALSLVTDKDWNTIYNELCFIGFNNKVMPNSDEAWKQYLLDRGFKYYPLKATKGEKRMTVDKFTRTKEYNEGKYLLRVANHVVAVVNGYSLDTWDCSSCCVYGYWFKG